ncbi:hypothetical protein BLA29_011473 [Euroglyphus maynei]|uniref:Uncharacterized protein n=1 Tax=Euroglyphus maynei TaxID=6958 RepID=A0A1Y3BIH1_EURMA|nr:hypothetical protein BLA29_011473 [Euroglyphus maynei]
MIKLATLFLFIMRKNMKILSYLLN